MDDADAPTRVACFATQGSGHSDERRIRLLLAGLAPTVYPFDRRRRLNSFLGVLRRLVRDRPDLLVVEGTGVAGGAAVLLGRLVTGTPYVLSTGDAVGPFADGVRRGLGVPFGLYELVLCRFSAGVIGWSPYLAGRALTLGAPRAMTAAGWAPARLNGPHDSIRGRVREELGIPADAMVFGIVGSLNWSRRYEYCYGLELVRALRRTSRPDLRVLVVGGGNGGAALLHEASADPRLIATGAVSTERVAEILTAFDVASLPQSVDGVGSFRYTTKLSEYLASGLPIVTGQIPAAYDLDDGWLWRLQGDAPWDGRYVDALAALMQSVTREDVLERHALVPTDHSAFDLARQCRLVTAFVRELM